MLNKKICYKCFMRPHRDAEEQHPGSRIGYDRWFEGTWKEGKAICCVLQFGRADINKDPPEHCRYVLEHMVNKDAE